MSRGLERIKKEYQKGDMLKKVHKNISTLILANLLIFITPIPENNFQKRYNGTIDGGLRFYR
jgi:hypothetical protein